MQIKKWKIFIKVFLLTTIILLLISLPITYREFKIQYQKTVNNISQLITLEQQVFSVKLISIGKDALITAKLMGLELGNKTNLNTKQLLAMTPLFYNISKQKPEYDQFRFMDKNGHEAIRINNRNGIITIVPSSQLQDKSSRYYFNRAKQLSDGKICVSNIDLNIENKRIEVPFVPMIRVTTPVFNVNNKFSGAVVINFKAEELLDNIRKLTSTINGDSFVINYKGYYVLHKNKNYQWGHILPARAKYNFSRDFPQSWKKIQQKDEGFFTTKRGIFIFKDIALCPDYATKHLRPTLLVYIPWKNLVAPIVYIYLELWLLITALLIIFSSIWTLYRSKKIYYEAELKKFATTDPLTGAANRKHFIDQTKSIIYNAERYNAIFALVMIDLDDFKQINDNYGHLVGDEALKALTNTIMSALRQTDILCRFGGEEFLILLQNSDIKAAIEIAERIRQKIASTPINTPKTQFNFTISAGVTTWHTDDSKIDELVKRADEAMYQAKQQGKNRVIKKV